MVIEYEMVEVEELIAEIDEYGRTNVVKKKKMICRKVEYEMVEVKWDEVESDGYGGQNLIRKTKMIRRKKTAAGGSK